MSSQLDKIHFVGLDSDTEDHFLPAGHFRHALNCNVGSSEESNVGSVENAAGNELVSFALPAGDNRCIGTYEDEVGDSTVYFVWNSNGYHSILRYFARTNFIRRVVQSVLLEFDKDHLITGVDYEDDLQYWTDGQTEQRKINIERAAHDKELQAHLYFQLAPPTGTDYTLAIYSDTGTQLIDQIVYTSTVAATSTSGIASLIASGINAHALSPGIFEATAQHNFIELNFKIPDYFDIAFYATSGTRAMAVYHNMYPEPLRRNYLDLIKSPPVFPPKTSFQSIVPNRFFNTIKLRLFQFRYRYIFDDGERSVLSPISKLPRSTGSDQFFTPAQNVYIEVNYGDLRVRQAAELATIEYVELYVREGNLGDWKHVTTLDRPTMVQYDFKYQFTNEAEYPVAANVDSDKPFDTIPLLSNALAIMNNRLFLDAKLEGYDPIIPNAELIIGVGPDYLTIPGLPFVEGGYKRSGSYKKGLVYFDRANRSNSVCTNSEMELIIPGYADYLDGWPNVYPFYPGGPNILRHGRVTVEWKIHHVPPLWATHYQWVMTRDSVHNDYIQATVLSRTDIKGDGTPGTPAIFWDLNFSHWASNNGAIFNHGWLVEPGDKIRYLQTSSGGGTPTPITAQPPLEGNVVSQDGDNIRVEAFASPPYSNFGVGGTLVEIYRPGKGTEVPIYYEIGECYEVLNPGTSNRLHQGQFTDQTINSPATGEFLLGDTYRRIRPMLIAGNLFSHLVESPMPLDIRHANFSTSSYDFGRANVVSYETGQAKRGHTVRISNPRFEGTSINGFSTFDSLDAKDLETNYGDVMKLARVDNILLSIHTREAVSLYIEENIYTDVNGQATVTISDRIIGTDRVLRGGFGTENPESFTIQDSRAYWFSTNKGQMIRYGGDGLTPISEYLMKRYFHTKGQQLMEHGGHVWTSYDVDHGKLIVAFSKIEAPDPNTPSTEQNPFPTILISDPETLVFDERSNRWTSYFSYHPEYLSKINNVVVSFLDGALYVHGGNTLRNNFYGVQYTSTITSVFNAMPSLTKIFKALSVESTSLWLPVAMSTPEGQQSHLIPEDFENLEGIWYAAILMDEQTPNVANPITQGDVMRSTVLRITLESDSTSATVLHFVNVDFIQSNLSHTVPNV